MTKLFYCVRGKEGISASEFSEHWLYPHAPLGLKDSRVLAYIQYHPLGYDPLDGMRRTPLVDPYQGVASAWWENAQVLEEYNADPAVMKDQQDMRFFIDHDKSVGALVEEIHMIEPHGAAPIVAFQFLRRSLGISRDEFREAWVNDASSGRLRAALVKAVEEDMIQGFVASVALPEGESESEGLNDLGTSHENWDGFGVLYFNSVATAKALAASDIADDALFMSDRDYLQQADVVIYRRHAHRQQQSSTR